MTTATRPTRPVRSGALRPSFSPELFDRLWDIHDVAAFIDASPATAWRTMKHPKAPPRLRLGTRTVRWDPRAVVEFLLTRTDQDGGTEPDGSTKQSATAKAALPPSDRVTVIAPTRPGSTSVPRPGAAARPAWRRSPR